LLTQVLFYSTSGCHLCDEALEVLTPVCHEFGLEVKQIDICTNEKLEQLYETRIPVISLQQQELDWPFTAAEARNFFLQQRL
jgi:glutaredoxin